MYLATKLPIFGMETKNDIGSQYSTKAQLAKQSNLPDTLKKVEDILDKLKKSSSAAMFNKPISKQEPLFEKYWKNYKTLSFIELNLKINKYADIDSLR